jgi:hypothetical protein
MTIPFSTGPDTAVLTPTQYTFSSRSLESSQRSSLSTGDSGTSSMSSLRRPSEVDPLDDRGRRPTRQASLASSIDIVDQQNGRPSPSIGTLTPHAEHISEHHSRELSTHSTERTGLEPTISRTSSVGQSPIGIEDLGEDRLPLLSRRKSSIRDGLTPMDSNGDIGLADIDDSASLRSTSSLWIS